MHWSTPISPFTKAITTWLWQNLEQNADVGMDPREGSIEIEAKIGTLVDVDSGHRIQLPVLNACVISPAQNRKMRFESEMNEVSVPHDTRYASSLDPEWPCDLPSRRLTWGSRWSTRT